MGVVAVVVVVGSIRLGVVLSAAVEMVVVVILLLMLVLLMRKFLVCCYSWQLLMAPIDAKDTIQLLDPSMHLNKSDNKGILSVIGIRTRTKSLEMW